MTRPNAFRFDAHPEARRFPALTPGALDVLAAEHEVEFCADFRDLLDAHNGYEFASVVTTLAVPENYHLVDLVRHLYGIDTQYTYNDLAARLRERPLGPGSAYLRWCYPIGDCRGGNLLVQISKGRYRGQVFLIDHDFPIVPEPLQQQFEQHGAERYHPDQLIPYLCSAETFVPLAPSLNEFLDGLQVMRTAKGNTNVAIVAGGRAGRLEPGNVP